MHSSRLIFRLLFFLPLVLLILPTRAVSGQPVSSRNETPSLLLAQWLNRLQSIHASTGRFRAQAIDTFLT